MECSVCEKAKQSWPRKQKTANGIDHGREMVLDFGSSLTGLSNGHKAAKNAN